MDLEMGSDGRGGIGEHGGWGGLSNDLGHEFELWVGWRRWWWVGAFKQL